MTAIPAQQPPGCLAGDMDPPETVLSSAAGFNSSAGSRVKWLRRRLAETKTLHV